MRQSFLFTAIFYYVWIFFIPEIVFSRSLTTTSINPAVSNSDTDEPVCYMQTVDGKTVNLSSLCEKNSTHSPTQPQTQRQVVISGVSYNDDYLTTYVVNQTGKTVQNVKVTCEFISEDGSVIKSISTDTDTPTLKPGQTATLQTFMPKGSQMRTTSVTWKE